jgi:hypothetical protein
MESRVSPKKSATNVYGGKAKTISAIGADGTGDPPDPQPLREFSHKRYVKIRTEFFWGVRWQARRYS